MSTYTDENPDMPYQMRIAGAFNWNDIPAACPECGQAEGLILTAFAVDSSTSFQCPNRHTWFRHDVPGKVVQTIYRAAALNPDATEITIRGDGR